MHIPEQVMQLADVNKGLVLITGPAGSGKSTTLACLLDRMNHGRTGHIITMEDPIEYVHKHGTCIITQREVPTDIATFPEALRSAMRESPDVILLGELRVAETIGTAMNAADMAQLVFIEAAIVYTRQRIGIQKMAISQVNFLFRSRYAQKHARVTGDTYIASRGLEAFARQMQRPIPFPAALVEKLFGDHFPAFFKEQTFVAEHIALRDKAHHRIFVEQECNLLLRLRV